MHNSVLSVATTIMLAVAVQAPAAFAQDGKELAKTLKCNACHSPTKEKDGPAYKATATKYKGKAGAADSITKAIMAKKDHPELKVSAKEADVKKVVEWILTQ